VANISYGGCRLLTHLRLPLGASLLLKIDAQTETFEATAKVMHSAPNDMGLMLGILPRNRYLSCIDALAPPRPTEGEWTNYAVGVVCGPAALDGNGGCARTRL
jgi:hypothetical protein